MKFSKEFIDLEVNFATRTSEVTGQPLEKTLGKYTGLGKNFNIPHSNKPGENPVWEEYLDIVLTAADIKDATYDFYLARRVHKLPKGNRIRFGCFESETENKGTLLRTHFSPKEDENGLGPLNKSNREKRMAELSGLFKFARANFPLVSTVGGFSWLYNIPAYAGLFPPEYARSGIAKEYFQSLALWGQFLQSSGDIRPETAVPFIAAITQANSWEELSKCFKYKPLETRCPVTRFYEYYGID